MDFDTLRKALEVEAKKIELQLQAEMADHVEWYKLISQIAKIVGSVPSQFPKGNEHIVHIIQGLVDDEKEYRKLIRRD